MKKYLIAVWLLLGSSAPLKAQNSATPSESVDIKSVVIRMERTQCYGPCPIYSVIITGDGTVTYDGKKFVKVKGPRVLRIRPEKVRSLVEAFFKADYFLLKESYDYLDKGNGIQEIVTDLPTTITSIQVNGKSKKVSNYYGGPSSLSALEHQIDETAGITKFIEKRKEKLD